MSDLIERLRELSRDMVHIRLQEDDAGSMDVLKAADQLEAQQAEIAQLKSQYSDVNEQLFSASLAYENEHIEKSDLETEIARLREATTEAEKMFRWYGDLHAAKPDPDKAARNYEMADKMAAALDQKP